MPLEDVRKALARPAGSKEGSTVNVFNSIQGTAARRWDRQGAHFILKRMSSSTRTIVERCSPAGLSLVCPIRFRWVATGATEVLEAGSDRTEKKG